jgi:hypothetical protein
MKLFASSTKRSRRILDKRVFVSHMYTLCLLLLKFGIVEASTKAARTDVTADKIGSTLSLVVH